MTMLDLTLEAFAISLLLASGPVRGKSQGQHLGRSSVFCTTAPRLCWSNTAPEARERPLILENKYNTVSGEYQIVNVSWSLFNTQVLLQSNLDQWISKKQEL